MLELIFKGLFQWLYELFLELVEYVSNALLDVFSMDLAYFFRTVPVASEITGILRAVGWALLLGNLVFQAARSMMSGIGFEAEDPKLLFTRTFVFSCLLVVSDRICAIGLDMTQTVIELLKVPSSVTVQVPDEAIFNSGAAWILVIIIGVVVGWQYIKLCIEVGERYIVLASLTILAPVAFGVGGSQSTADIFKGWARMYGSMCFMMVSNVIFLKMLISALAYVPVGLDAIPWAILILAIAKVARKVDEIITRIGLNPAITGSGLGRNLPGMLAYTVVRGMTSTISHTIGKGMGGKAAGGAQPPSSGGPGGSGASGNGGKRTVHWHRGSTGGAGPYAKSGQAGPGQSPGSAQTWGTSGAPGAPGTESSYHSTYNTASGPGPGTPGKQSGPGAPGAESKVETGQGSAHAPGKPGGTPRPGQQGFTASHQSQERASQAQHTGPDMRGGGQFARQDSAYQGAPGGRQADVKEGAAEFARAPGRGPDTPGGTATGQGGKAHSSSTVPIDRGGRPVQERWRAGMTRRTAADPDAPPPSHVEGGVQVPGWRMNKSQGPGRGPQRPGIPRTPMGQSENPPQNTPSQSPSAPHEGAGQRRETTRFSSFQHQERTGGGPASPAADRPRTTHGASGPSGDLAQSAHTNITHTGTGPSTKPGRPGIPRQDAVSPATVQSTVLGTQAPSRDGSTMPVHSPGAPQPDRTTPRGGQDTTRPPRPGTPTRPGIQRDSGPPHAAGSSGMGKTTPRGGQDGPSQTQQPTPPVSGFAGGRQDSRPRTQQGGAPVSGFAGGGQDRPARSSQPTPSAPGFAGGRQDRPTHTSQPSPSTSGLAGGGQDQPPFVRGATPSGMAPARGGQDRPTHPTGATPSASSPPRGRQDRPAHAAGATPSDASSPQGRQERSAGGYKAPATKTPPAPPGGGHISGQPRPPTGGGGKNNKKGRRTGRDKK